MSPECMLQNNRFDKSVLNKENNWFKQNLCHIFVTMHLKTEQFCCTTYKDCLYHYSANITQSYRSHEQEDGDRNSEQREH